VPPEICPTLSREPTPELPQSSSRRTTRDRRRSRTVVVKETRRGAFVCNSASSSTSRCTHSASIIISDQSFYRRVPASSQAHTPISAQALIATSCTAAQTTPFSSSPTNDLLAFGVLGQGEHGDLGDAWLGHLEGCITTESAGGSQETPPYFPPSGTHTFGLIRVTESEGRTRQTRCGEVGSRSRSTRVKGRASGVTSAG